MIHSLAGITIGTNFLLKTSAKILNKILPQKQCDQFFIRVNFCKNQSGIRAKIWAKSWQKSGHYTASRKFQKSTPLHYLSSSHMPTSIHTKIRILSKL